MLTILKKRSLPRIAITMGDPAGVGPEICLRALAEESLESLCVPVIVGDAAVLRLASERMCLPLPALIVPDGEAPAAVMGRIDQPAIVDLAAFPVHLLQPGVLSAETGRASFAYINSAIDAVLAKTIDAVVTGPISKEALHAAGIHFPGHTEIFASRTNAARSCMMQYSDEITCSFVTTHIGYAEVPGHLSSARILDVIELTAAALRRIRGREPKLIICGLNPHAGEHGLFGEREEERIIQPAIDAARAQGIEIVGPLPPDTAFIPANRRAFDAVVCMYHDQGHIPVKALAFDSAVNTTLGLPIIRTSVDHGTAYDIAWQGKASHSSLLAAIRLAVKLAV